MMTIQPTTIFNDVPGASRGKPESKDPSTSDDFMNLLASLCCVALIPQMQNSPSEPAQDSGASLGSAANPAIEQTGISPLTSLRPEAPRVTPPVPENAESDATYDQSGAGPMPPTSPSPLSSLRTEFANLTTPVLGTATNNSTTTESGAIPKPVPAPLPPQVAEPDNLTPPVQEVSASQPAPEQAKGAPLSLPNFGADPVQPTVAQETAIKQLSADQSVTGPLSLATPSPTVEPASATGPEPQTMASSVAGGEIHRTSQNAPPLGPQEAAPLATSRTPTTAPQLPPSAPQKAPVIGRPNPAPMSLPVKTQPALPPVLQANLQPIAARVVRPELTDTSVATTPTKTVTEPNSDAAAKSVLSEATQTLADGVSAAQTLQEQAAQRDASMIAGYLAAATRSTRETNPLLAIRREFAGNSDLHSNEDKHGATGATGAAAQLRQNNVSFASVAAELADASPDSPVAQSISHILALAETLSVRQIRTIRLRLKPEELGGVEIQLKRDAQGRISAHLTAERETARQSLSQSLGQLRETLERAGLTVDRLQVRAETSQLRGNNNDQARSQYRKPQSQNARSLTIGDTEERGASGIRDHKLLSLNA